MALQKYAIVKRFKHWFVHFARVLTKKQECDNNGSNQPKARVTS